MAKGPSSHSQVRGWALFCCQATGLFAVAGDSASLGRVRGKEGFNLGDFGQCGIPRGEYPSARLKFQRYRLVDRLGDVTSNRAATQRHGARPFDRGIDRQMKAKPSHNPSDCESETVGHKLSDNLMRDHGLDASLGKVLFDRN